MIKYLALLWLFAASSTATPGRVVKHPLDPGLYILGELSKLELHRIRVLRIRESGSLANFDSRRPITLGVLAKKPFKRPKKGSEKPVHGS